MNTRATKKETALTGHKLRALRGEIAGQVGTVVPAPNDRMGGIFAKFGRRLLVLSRRDLCTLYELA